MQLPENTLLSGGRFRIIRCLGQGGFGITYLAEDNMLGVNVAIKEFFIGQYCNRDARTGFVSVGVESMRGAINDFYDKFIKEAGKIRTLNHPNIVRVYDVFKENGTAYYIMDFHSNGSLSDLVKKQGAMSEKVALRYIRQVASALKYIHSRNMMHLDVKPDNILLDSEGNAILIDFGISKHYDKEGKATTLTPGGYTPGYAAGSQMAGSKVNSFSPTLDIYSLGATLYNLLTGEEPPLVSEIYDYGFPPLPKEVSAATRATIERSMSPKSLDRPQSIDEFLGLLPDITDDKEPERLKQPKRPFNWKKFAGVVATVLCVALAGFGVKECYDYRAEQAREKARQDSIAAADKKRNAFETKIFNVNGIEFTMMPVDGGTFNMGSNDGEAYNKPVHSVTLSDYYIGETEVTQELWLAVMGSNPSRFDFNGDKNPVEQVSYHDCIYFINNLNTLLSDQLPDGRKFRLPTEAQWEFAARGGNKSKGYKYSGSNNIDEVANYKGNCDHISVRSTAPVKHRQPNELGLYDMSGNVWEWCSDWYADYSSSPQINPEGPSNGEERVHRGGCWGSYEQACGVAYRRIYTGDFRGPSYGLRLAID